MRSDPFVLPRGGIFRCTADWHCDWTYEPHDKWYFPIAGEAFYDCGAGEFRLAPGRIWLVPGRRRQRYRCPRELRLHWVHVVAQDPRIEAAFDALPAARSWPASAWRTWRGDYSRLAEWFDRRPAGLGLRLQAMLLWSCAELVDALPAAAPRSPAIAAAVAFLDEHARRRPPLAAVARAAGLSPVYLHRRFVAEVGATPHAYAERRRLAIARDLLADGDLAVAEVATRSGYHDPFHFSRVFRRAVGESPQAWRRRERAP